MNKADNTSFLAPPFFFTFNRNNGSSFNFLSPCTSTVNFQEYQTCNQESPFVVSANA